ncbi:MAG: bifunctional diaminohydroxyphosphoribosylaminopyrimidine deaminase/5-amino-6-(5-phosphoribosylamino)uracil reductase RibD [Bdellovibrionales bacterium]|nr:bifunctional diaminohydroxyphosphoribosylaminopyrimidine deaminase/5-amino-6-(5-phosphoribosylamino)uracil reductase RibD [Bdellovibrionales bacterium]
MKTHRYWMKKALALSQKGLGFVNPNPMVGAIVVDQNNQKISDGYHERYGQSHAEKVALEKAGSRANGATLYVTLEPCSHTGKTPPCVDQVIKSKVKRVVIGCKDPNPIVQSIDRLRENGIEVIVGVEEKKIQKLNRIFFHYIQNQSPYIIAKVAMDTNGYIGHINKRLQISDPATIPVTMKLRAMVDAIIVGKNTWKTDDPILTVRGKYHNRKPARVLLDPKLEISPEAKIFQQEGGPIVLLYDSKQSTPHAWMGKKGIETVSLETAHGFFTNEAICTFFKMRSYSSVLIEGGATLLKSFFPDVHQWIIYQSTKDLTEAYPPKDLISLGLDPFSLQAQSAIRLGQDQMLSNL